MKEEKMLKKENDPKRKDQLITIVKTLTQMHNSIVLLQEAYMKCQQDLFHEKWKYRHVARTLKRVAKKLGEPDLVMSEEELDAQIRGKEN
jgi:hypothetical protein|tara:strand:- start:278 stop:547 length:270 start_codon:yes stop_codon:yes gene_type:complete